MQRKKINVNDVEKELEDIAGIRLICQFVEDIDRVLEIIESRSDMEIKSHKDYISHSKDSGYRSYHVIIYYEVNTIYGKKRIQAEIQIRTLAMNFWATVEHSLQYKYKGDIPQHVTDKLLVASDAVSYTHLDVYKRQGYDTFFLTGTDEHGQKIENKAREAGVTPQEYVDNIVVGIKELWRLMDVDYSDCLLYTSRCV